MYPLGLDWVEPRTFRRQKKGQNAHPFALSLDLLVLLSDPGPHLLAVMPEGIIPDQKPASLALLLQSSADPLAAHWVVMALIGRPFTKRSDI